MVLPDVSAPLKLAALLAFVVTALPLRKTDWRAGLPLLLLVGLFAVATWRSSYASSGNWTAVVALAVLVGWLGLKLWGRPSRERLVCAALAPVVFAVTNLMLWLAGIRSSTGQVDNASQGASTLLEQAGVYADRAALPLTPGLNGGGAMAALGFVVAVAFVVKGSGAARQFCIVAAPVSFVSILLTDSRGALLFAALTLVGLALVPRRASRTFAALVLLLPFAPALVLAVADRLGGFAATLSRNPGDFATATGRADVWAAIWERLPTMDAVFGWGLYGQRTSGASIEYAHIFPGSEQPLLATAHNAGLQLVLDVGLVGLGVFVWLVVAAINAAATHYRSSRSGESLAVLGGLVCVVMLGATEAFPSMYIFYGMCAFAVLAAVAFAPAPVAVPAREPFRVAPVIAWGTWGLLVAWTVSLMQF